MSPGVSYFLSHYFPKQGRSVQSGGNPKSTMGIFASLPLKRPKPTSVKNVHKEHHWEPITVKKEPE